MNKNNSARATVLLLVATLVSACASTTPPVVEELDYDTGVTFTYSRTPFVFSPNEKAEDFSAVEYVQIGMIEINTMGTLRYYLWMGISEPKFSETSGKVGERFEFVNFDVDGREFRLDAIGSSHEAIGTSGPIYEGLFKTTEDVYYEITLEQIGFFVAAADVSFRTADPTAEVYRPWYRSVSPQEDLAEFYRAVLE